jgi:hypothetical protein
MKSAKEFRGIFIHREAIDMRKGINGLSEIVQLENMGELMCGCTPTFFAKALNE